MSMGEIFPHLAWILQRHGPVQWIYLAMLLGITVRVWISLRLFALDPGERPDFLARTAGMADAIGNIALLCGVMGTLVGVAMATMEGSGGGEGMRMLDQFGRAFGISITTTLAGGLAYIICQLLTSIDEYLFLK